MIIIPNSNKIQLLKDTMDKKNIIVASEIILSYKLSCRYKNSIVIGVPNVISKIEIKKLDRIRNIDKIFVLMDTHTALHSSENLLTSLINKYGEDKVFINVSLKNGDIPKRIDDFFEEKDYNICLNSA